MPESHLSSDPAQSLSWIYIVVGVSLAVGLAIVVVVACCCVIQRRKRLVDSAASQTFDNEVSLRRLDHLHRTESARDVDDTRAHETKSDNYSKLPSFSNGQNTMNTASSGSASSVRTSVANAEYADLLLVTRHSNYVDHPSLAFNRGASYGHINVARAAMPNYVVLDSNAQRSNYDLVRGHSVQSNL